MTIRSRAPFLFATLVLALGTPGCGGGSSGGSSVRAPITLVVDSATSVTTGAQAGTADLPFKRITDALARARTLRATTDAPIVVSVSAGTYVGSYTSAATATAFEVLPLIVNVSDLELRGQTPLVVSADALPTGFVTASATIL